MDNWRLGPGASMFYPVAVDGGLVSIGDPHASQGDGEVSGCALEASLHGLLRLVVRGDLDLTGPLLETRTEIFVHGFGDDLDEAMHDAALRTIALLRSRFGMSASDAYALCSVAVDFAVTQVVDGRQGVHARIDKRCLASWR